MDQNKNEQEVLIYTLTDEEGKETEFALLDQYEENGNLYYALVPVDDDGEEYVILRATVDGEDLLFETIEDDDEFEKVEDYFNDLLFNEVDYDEN